MTEEKKEPTEVEKAGTRIADLESQVERLKRENRALRGKGKMLTTSTITAPPLARPRPNIMISTTQPRPHQLGGKPPMLQTHGLKLPELDAAEILARVKGHREADTKKETTK